MKKVPVRDPVPQAADNALQNYSELQRRLLWYRGIKTAEAADVFLNPSYERDLHDPFLILNLEKAVDRILAAIEAKEQVVIYGDYDCDGIPGTTALYGFFEKINYPHLRVYVPHRYREGYGLNNEAIQQFSNDDVKLIITIDSGITDVEQVAFAQRLGIDVIITDHHLVQEKVPKAFAVVNSKQSEDTYPFDQLCGAGVAFKLVQGLLKKGNFGLSEGWEKWLLDVVGIATIADMVPLTGENRVLAYFGLKVLRQTPRTGLAHLLQKMGVKREHLNEDDVGFSIAPVVNAASRLGTPIDAFHMLASRNPVQAMGQAEALYALNTERKIQVKTMIQEAHAMVGARELGAVLVVGRQEWKPGLLGLAASSLAEHYERPTFVWGREGSTEVKGSCRSDGRVNMVDLMVAAGDVFVDRGGHAFAGGFSCADEQLERLESALAVAHASLAQPDVDMGCPSLIADKKVEIDEVTWKMYDEVTALAPFGVGNEKPLFLLENVPVAAVRMFGKEKNHLQLNLQKSDRGIVPAIKFFTKQSPVRAGERVSLLAHLEKSTFGYKPELRLRIVDIW